MEQWQERHLFELKKEQKRSRPELNSIRFKLIITSGEAGKIRNGYKYPQISLDVTFYFGHLSRKIWKEVDLLFLRSFVVLCKYCFMLLLNLKCIMVSNGVYFFGIRWYIMHIIAYDVFACVRIRTSTYGYIWIRIKYFLITKLNHCFDDSWIDSISFILFIQRWAATCFKERFSGYLVRRKKNAHLTCNERMTWNTWEILFNPYRYILNARSCITRNRKESVKFKHGYHIQRHTEIVYWAINVNQEK